jgi:2-polyprenyl-3-methyl-5-hydroxy-6-metoxy-1,4-benzoquinol methylase
MPNTITKSYKKLNEQLHETNETYGTSGWKWAKHVKTLSEEFKTTDILDYGCGKSTLQRELPFEIFQYDPAIQRHSKYPSAHDIVVCTDVLEHIEPEYLNVVLDELHKLTKKVILLTIATRPACKTLPDGRNTHLIVENGDWWIEKLNKRFTIKNKFGSERKFTIIGFPKV